MPIGYVLFLVVVVGDVEIRPVAVGVYKMPFLATKWAKNGVIFVGLGYRALGGRGRFKNFLV